MLNEFRCFSCTNQTLLSDHVDPTSSTGCCRECGSRAWNIYETSLTEEEYFKAKLAKKKSIQYQIYIPRENNDGVLVYSVKQSISPLRY